MHKIAVIQFPGTNCEYESLRAIKKAGMDAELFRWNEDYEKLAKYDGFFIPGGFSYEDRVRSGGIAAKDALLEVIKKESEKQKPIIGICNGAQILFESGLVPGLENYKLGGSLAANKKGYLNLWVNIKNTSSPGRCAFNYFDQGHYFRLPIAHGEGRFVIDQKLLDLMIERQQTVFRYCDDKGEIRDEYPINPNGAQYNLAGVCNSSGNVLALMPHPERTKDGMVVFDSMKKYLDQGPKPLSKYLFIEESIVPRPEVLEYIKPEKTSEILVDLKITDNEAQSLEKAIKAMGIDDINVNKFTHWEIGLDLDDPEVIKKIIDSGEILNTNKEIPYQDDAKKLCDDSHKLLVRYADDFEGQNKLATLKGRLGIQGLDSVKKGILWEIKCSKEDWDKILKNNILYNPFSQIAKIYKDTSMQEDQANPLINPSPAYEQSGNYKEIIERNFDNVLQNTDFSELGSFQAGKVRDSYFKEDQVVMVTTDRQSAFDRILASIPFKGQVLNQVSLWWFEKTKNIIPNYVIDSPDPNVLLGKKCTVYPFEVVVRGYLTGSTETSIWVNYQRGTRYFCGNWLHDGMKKNERLVRPIITPTTKFEEHDRNISPNDIISEGMATPEEWEYISEKALELFKFGQEIAASNGLILVDTKYEFGKDEDGDIILIDEIHTPDSSRYWIADSYLERFKQEKEPDNIDKEFLRLWFKDHCDPYKDKNLPQAPRDLVVELSSRYIQLYEMITGEKFVFDELPILERVKKNLMQSRGRVVIFMGSDKDNEWAHKIQDALFEWGIGHEKIIASAHKVPEKVAQYVERMNKEEALVYITIAGRSNALSGVIASNSVHPVIACPPFKDKSDMLVNIHSTLQMPSNSPVLTVLDPGNAAAAAARLLGLYDKQIQEKVIQKIVKIKDMYSL